MNRLSAAARFLFVAASANFSNKPLPLFVNLNVTNRCVWSCRYCDFPNLYSKECTADDIDSLFREIRNTVVAVTITGGEPAVREDLGEIVSSIRRHTNAYIKIDTSGVHLSRTLDTLLSVDAVQISYDGPADFHDLQRGTGSHAIARRAVETLRKKKQHVILNSVVTRASIEHQAHILSYAEDTGASYACNRLITNSFTPNNDPDGIDDASFLAFLESLDANRHKVSIAIPRSTVAKYRQWLTHSKRRPCAINNNLVFIECNGKVHRCPYVLSSEPESFTRNGFYHSYDSLPRTYCETCVPNLLAFGDLCRLYPPALVEQFLFSQALIVPFQTAKQL